MRTINKLTMAALVAFSLTNFSGSAQSGTRAFARVPTQTEQAYGEERKASISSERFRLETPGDTAAVRKFNEIVTKTRLLLRKSGCAKDHEKAAYALLRIFQENFLVETKEDKIGYLSSSVNSASNGKLGVWDCYNGITLIREICEKEKLPFEMVITPYHVFAKIGGVCLNYFGGKAPYVFPATEISKHYKTAYCITDSPEKMMSLAYTNLSFSSRASRDWQGALEYMKIAISLAPEVADYYGYAGDILVSSGGRANLELALEYYDKEIAIRPNAVVFNNKGAAHDMLGDREAAVAHYNRALSLDPEFAKAKMNLDSTSKKSYSRGPARIK